VTDIALLPVTDVAAVGERWRSLEALADCSFYQSRTWTGCLAEERFPDPVLLEARHNGETIALALFNRRRVLRQSLLLGETQGDRI
jgi:CelD/BcsL family acetyltransferase involved in cellulose biosynthesis